jgi:hypothetical protein
MRQTAQKLKLFAGKPLLVLFLMTPMLVFGIAGKYFLNNQAIAATNSTINFQARLMNAAGSIAPDGDYNIEFKLYNALTSSGSSQGSCTGDAACKWTETRTSANKVHVANGFVSVNLGSVTSFPTTINWDQQLWLTMNIGGTGSPSWDGEMTPRLKLTGVPYAFRAGQLASLAGSFSGVLQFAGTFGQDSVITLPDPVGATATVCYQNSMSCGFATGTASSYIQNTTTVQNPGNFAIRSAATGSVGGVIQGANGQTADLLQLQTWNGTTANTAFAVSNVGALSLLGNGSTMFTTTKAVPDQVPTKINIPAYDPGAFGQILAFGLPSGANASSRAISVFDARTGAHQPSIAVLSPDENSIFGFSWEGSNTTAYLKTTSANINVTTGGGDIATFNSTAISLLQSTTIAGGKNLTLNSGAGNFDQSASTGTFSTGSGTVSLAGNTTVTGTKTFLVNGGLATLQAGLTASGGVVQLNASSNNNTSINTGTSTGSVSIGNSAAGTLALQSGSTIAIATTNFNLSAAGVITLAGAQTSDITTANSAGGAANAIALQPGSSGGASSSGAAVSIKGGNGSGTTNVTGGAVTIQGGNATGGSGTRIGGSVTLDAGTGDVAANNGTVSIGTTNAKTVTLGGGSTTAVKVAVLGSATAASAAVCRDTATNTLTACDGINTAGRAFLQGGNAFAATAVLGTTDANSLQIVTGASATVRATFDTSNALYLGNGVTASAPSNFTVAATGSTTAGTAGATLTLQGGGGTAAGTGSAGGGITIQGGSSAGGSGNNAGGNVTLSGGAPANSGTAGKVLVKNTADSANAFQVQNSGGTVTVFDVDTTNSYVGIGTAGPARQLHVAVNNTTVNALPVLVEQTSTGDTGLELKTSSKNFYVGIDNTDGQFKISSAAAANGTFTQGNVTQEIGTDSNSGGSQALKFTASASGMVSSMSVYISSVASPNNQIQFGIYGDNGSGTSPNTLLASTSSQTAVVGWNTISLSGVSITSGAVYWIAMAENGATVFMRGSGGTTAYHTATGYPLTNPFAANTGNSTDKPSFYITVASTGSSDYFGGTPLFRMSDTGATTLQNVSNSTGAFQVQNAAGVNLLGLDTTNAVLNLGVVGATAAASTVNIATSTGAAQAINIGSATTGSAANGTTVLVQGGNTATAVQIQALASGTINVGSANAANTIQIGSSTLSSGTQVINIGNNNTSGGTTNINIGTGTTATAGTTALQAKTAVTVATNGITRATFDNTNTLYLGNGSSAAAPNNFVVSGTSSGTAAVAGANITLIGGNGNTTAAGGDAKLQGGTGGATSVGGNAVLQGGTGGATSGTGGQANVTGGTAIGAFVGGAVNIQGGAAAATAGSNGGAITIASGNGSTTGTGGAGATILMNAGNAGGSGNNAGGSVIAELGASTGTGAQGTFQVQNALGASLLTVDPSNTAASLNLISNGGAETGSPPTGWAAQGAGSSVATGTGTDAASSAQSAKVTFGTSANAGTKVNFTIAPTASATVNYIVSFSAKLVSGTALSNTLQVVYSPDNGTTLTQTCSNYSTQGLSTTAWTKVTCTFVPGVTTVTTALLIVRQTDGPGVSRIIDIDNMSVVQQNTTGTQNVGDLKVGGAVSQGLTLLTLDTYAATPFSGTNSSLAGSMYFDTSQGKIQCYDGTTWGACGAAPNNIITLTPEYAGAVLHTSGSSSIGTMTSDFCSGTTGININDGTSSQPSICSSTQTFNFYRWTSPQGSAQQYSIWVTYQLPSTFKSFVNGTTTLTGRTDSANSTVQYTIYKNVSGNALTTCSASATVSTGSQSNWQVVAPTTDPSTCGFAAGNSIIFKIDVISSNNANAYASNLNFAFSNQ